MTYGRCQHPPAAGPIQMGPWGFATFEDELACDWLEDLFDSDPIVFLRHCLDLGDADEIDYLAGIGVICTAEIIHGLCDEPRVGMPPAVHVWLCDHHSLKVSHLLEDAIAGIHRVLEPTSELWVRWEDNEAWGDHWYLHNADLLRRLEEDRRRIRNGDRGFSNGPPHRDEHDDDPMT